MMIENKEKVLRIWLRFITRMVFYKLQKKLKRVRISECSFTIEFLELNHQLSGTKPGSISF